MRVLEADAVYVLQNPALGAFAARVARWPFGLVVVLRFHHITEWYYLHIAIKGHYFVLLSDLNF